MEHISFRSILFGAYHSQTPQTPKTCNRKLSRDCVTLVILVVSHHNKCYVSSFVAQPRNVTYETESDGQYPAQINLRKGHHWHIQGSPRNSYLCRKWETPHNRCTWNIVTLTSILKTFISIHFYKQTYFNIESASKLLWSFLVFFRIDIQGW